MPTRNVVLTERQEKLIEALVQAGRYQNASEVLRDGPLVIPVVNDLRQHIGVSFAMSFRPL